MLYADARSFLNHYEIAVLKALRKIFGKADGAQPQSGSSPIPQGPAGATAKNTAPTDEKPTKKHSRRPRAPRVGNESGAPRAVERTEKGEKSAKPAAKGGWDAKPHSDKPRRKHKPKPVDNWKLEDPVAEPQEGKTRFHDFNLAPSLMHAIHDLGFPYCTPIQAQVLSLALRGQDAISRAQTGIDKIAALLISIITQLLQAPPPKGRYMSEPRALIIAPTHELVVQIAKDAAALTKYTGPNMMTFVDDTDFDKQLKQLEACFCDILVTAPDRLLDFNQRDEVYLDMAEVMILDGADHMSGTGSIPQVRQIVRQTPHRGERQTLLFPATFIDNVINLAKQWTIDPTIIEIEPENAASDIVKQHVYAVAGSDKYELLYNLVTQNGQGRVMVFASHRGEVRHVEERLTKDDISAAQMSGDVPQYKHIHTLEGFREGGIRILVATDVAGRGIHIDGIDHVINSTLPEDPDDYVHRIDCTSRTGTSGTSIGFAGEDGTFTLLPVEELLGRKTTCEMPPAKLLKPIPRKY